MKAALDGHWRCCRPLSTSAIVARVVILSAKKWSIFGSKIEPFSSVKYPRALLFTIPETTAHTYSAYQLKSVYISALIKSFIYISTSPNNSLAANTRHLQYIYHGLFHEREAVWFKRVESFFFWGRRGWRYTFRFAPNLTISASLNQQRSAPKMLNSWQTAACFASGTLFVMYGAAGAVCPTR